MRTILIATGFLSIGLLIGGVVVASHPAAQRTAGDVALQRALADRTAEIRRRDAEWRAHREEAAFLVEQSREQATVIG